MNNTTTDSTQQTLPQVVYPSLYNLFAIITSNLCLPQILGSKILCCPTTLPNKSFRKAFSGQLSLRHHAQNADLGLLQIGFFYVLILVLKPP